MYCTGTSCWLACIGFAILWWVVASVLVFFAWNRVLATLFKLAKLKWWHPFLVIATVAVLLAPCASMHRGGCGPMAKSHCARGPGHDHGHGAQGGHCADCKKGAKGDCAGDCKGKCDGKCKGKCSGGECAGGTCPHHGSKQ